VSAVVTAPEESVYGQELYHYGIKELVNIKTVYVGSS
jgi:hypothetical protein